MATTTFQPYTGNGSNKTFNYSFPTYTASEVVVEVDGVVVDNFTIPGYQTTGTRTVTFDNSTGTLNTDLCESDGAPKNNLEVIVRRDTNVDNAKATFTAGSSLKAADLTDSVTQILRSLQEEQNTPTTTPRIRDQAITSAKIKNLTIVDEDISATAEIEVYKLKDGAANQVLVTQSDGTTTNWSSNLDLPGTLDVTGNVDLDANLNVDGTTTLDGTTVDGVLDVNGSATIDNVQVNGNEIDTTSGNLTIDSAGGTTTVDDNLAVTGTLNITQGITLQNASATLNGSQIVTETASQTLTNKTLTTPVINDLSGTAVVTSGTSTSDNKIYSAKRSDELYYRKGTADDIEESGVPWSGNDSTIATTAAIDARIVDLVDDVGGFVPLVDEGEIPQYHPEKENKDTADRVGTILSIGTLTQTYTPSTGTVTIQASDLTNHSVNATITDCGSTVLSSGFGVLVETKAQTDSQYAAGPSFKFHRLVPKATEVTTVAANATQIGTVHTNITQVQTVHNNISNINAVAADATDIGAVAAKATEIGRLGTADAVADMAILGTTDVVSDLNTLGTADVVADMNMLATSDVIADMNMLAVSDVISDMNDLATSGNITAMSNCSGSIANINTTASNLTNVNNFADRYQIAANNPSTDGGGNALAAGDLYFNTSANELKVYNGSSWQAGVTATGSFALTTGNTFTGDNKYNDGVKLLVGTGSDLEIYHSGSDSYIDQDGTGHLFIRGNGSNGIHLRAKQDEDSIKCHSNAAVELYYDNSKKFETTSIGGTLTGHFNVNDTSSDSASARIYLQSGNTADSSIYFGRANDSATAALRYEHTSNAFQLWGYNNSLRAEINSSGNFRIPNDSGKITFGTGDDLQIYHDGTDSRIHNSTGSLVFRTGTNYIFYNSDASKKHAQFLENGAVELYHNNSKKFETYSGGVEWHGNLKSETDGDKIALGAANDLQIYHSGSHSFIDHTNGTGHLIINSSATNNVDIMRAGHGEYMARFKPDNAAELYYDNSKKFETTSSGNKATGKLGIDDGDGSSGNYLSFGNSDDMKIFHSGSHSMIKHFGTGNFFISCDNEAEIVLRPKLNESGIVVKPNGSAELFYDHGKKFETLSDGASVTGHLGIGTTSPNKSSTNAAISVNGSSNSIVELCTGDARKGNIYTDGTNMFLTNNSTGYLQLSVKNTETAIKAINDGAVELYHDNTLRAYTTNVGLHVNTIVSVSDNGKFRCGNGDDLEIYHGGSNSYISNATGTLFVTGDTIKLRNAAANEDYIEAFQNGSVRLYYDNSEKIRTGHGGEYGSFQALNGANGWDGMSVANNRYVFMGNESSEAVGIWNDHANEWMIKVIADGSVKLYYNGNEKFQTQSDGVAIEDSNPFLRLNGSASTSGDTGIFLNANANHWIVKADNYSSGNQFQIRAGDTSSSELALSCAHNAAVKLNYDNSTKLETESSGARTYGDHNVTGEIHLTTDNQSLKIGAGADLRIKHDGTHNYVNFVNGALIFQNNGTSVAYFHDSDGHFIPWSNNTFDLGSSGNRWRNVYTNDLHLSNEGSSNDVDSTWGNWTIQEGESDLFLKNNRSGKKYKFNLTEVS